MTRLTQDPLRVVGARNIAQLESAGVRDAK